MADVQFFGIGATGFPDPNVQILPANPGVSPDVQFGQASPTAVGELATQSETFSPTLTAAPGFTEVTFETPSDPFPPISRSPNDNNILLIVTGGPTMGGTQVNVIFAAAKKFEDDDFVEQPPVRYPTDDPRLFAVPGSAFPSGMVGLIARFIQPTGVSEYAAIRGVTARIANILPGATGLGDPAPGESANATTFRDGYAIEFDRALSPQATTGDRLVFARQDEDQVLRRSPILEIILENKK